MNSMFNNPSKREIIRKSCGLLDGKERVDRILEVSEIDFVLAAKCKNTRPAIEENLITKLILKSIKVFDNDPFEALIGLCELEEFFIVGSFLCEKYNKESANFLITMKNFCFEESIVIDKAFDEIIDFLPISEKFLFFKKIQKHNYNLRVSAYNKILPHLEYKDIIPIFKSMQAKGIKLNINTCIILIRKSPDIKEKGFYYRKGLELASNYTERFRILSAYSDEINNIKLIKNDIRAINNFIDRKNVITNKDRFPISKLLINLIRLSYNNGNIGNYFDKLCIIGREVMPSVNSFFRQINNINSTLDYIKLKHLVDKKSFSRSIKNKLIKLNIANEETDLDSLYLGYVSQFVLKFAKQDDKIKIIKIFNHNPIYLNPKLIGEFISELNEDESFAILYKIFLNFDSDDFMHDYFNQILLKLEFSASIELLNEFSKSVLSPNILNYNVLINRAGTFEEAFSLIKKAIHKNIELNNDSFLLLLKKEISSNDLYRTAQFFKNNCSNLNMDKAVKNKLAPFL